MCHLFYYWSLFYNKVISTFDTIIVICLNQIRNNLFIDFKEINNQDLKSTSVKYLDHPKAYVCAQNSYYKWSKSSTKINFYKLN